MADNRNTQIDALRKKIHTVLGARIEDLRKDIHAVLASLTPREAKVLRAVFGRLKTDGELSDQDDEVLRKLARKLGMLKKKKDRR